MNTHVFDQAIALQPQGPDHFLGHTSPAYANMVGPFGGIMAAQALNAVLQHPALLGEPVALTVNFAAAMADGAFLAQARAVRTNRSTQHWIVEITQDGQTVLTATAITALRRETWELTEVPMPAVPPPAAVEAQGGKGPMEFPRRYESRCIAGGWPAQWDGSLSESSQTLVWLRDQPPRPLDFASLACIADHFYPRLFVRRARMVPVGTVSMTVYFHADSEQLRATGSGYLLGQANAQAFRKGYFDQTAQLWNEAGALLATSHQTVYYKE